MGQSGATANIPESKPCLVHFSWPMVGPGPGISKRWPRAEAGTLLLPLDPKAPVLRLGYFAFLNLWAWRAFSSWLLHGVCKVLLLRRSRSSPALNGPALRGLASPPESPWSARSPFSGGGGKGQLFPGPIYPRPCGGSPLDWPQKRPHPPLPLAERRPSGGAPL